MKGEVVSVNVSARKGTAKRPVPEAVIDERGIAGDAHAGNWLRQVSLLSQESIDRFSAEEGGAFAAGDFAENVTVRWIDLSGAAVLDRFRIGTALLEVTQIGKKCHADGCSVFQMAGRCVMPKEGIFCRVLEGGAVRPGDAAEYLPRTLKVRIITLSDRAFRGEYSDMSGPRIAELLQSFAEDRRRRMEIETTLLPDDAEKLRVELIAARDAGVDVVFTTGGTGVGPRDITPETAAAVCDKLIPGIMENIRVKFGSQKPNALLSRGVAGIAGTTQVYTLPGSLRAVEEYTGEILKTMEHVLFMVHGLDVHPAPPVGERAGVSSDCHDEAGCDFEDAIRPVEALRFSSADVSPQTDHTRVVVEQAVTITVEGVGDFTLTCTPRDLDALEAGFVFLRGMIDTRNVEEILAGLPKCGDSLRGSRALLNAAVEKMRSRQEVFAVTGATHAAAIFRADGGIAAFGEDVGRHNAMDKAVGRCLPAGGSCAGCGVALSGRVDFALVVKAARAGIELIAAVSAPTSLAIDAAERTGITLCAFVRDDRATVYTHPHRIHL